MDCGWIGSLGRRLLNGLCPPTCFSCGNDIVTGDCLCARCFASLHMIVSPCCSRCGEPLSQYEVSERDGCCVECVQCSPVWRYARAAFVYDDASRRLVFPLKYSDRIIYARFLASFMERAATHYLDQNVILVPVPLHKKKLRRRRYNQAALLAFHIAKKNNSACVPDALRRIRHTRSLARLSVLERQEELHNTFDVNPHYRSFLVGKRVVIVDDILTTGATASACARVLNEAGCASVDVVVAARVCLQRANV